MKFNSTHPPHPGFVQGYHLHSMFRTKAAFKEAQTINSSSSNRIIQILYHHNLWDRHLNKIIKPISART